MEYAIISNKTKRLTQDNNGNPCLFMGKDKADEMCAVMNRERAKLEGVDTLHGSPTFYRVIPW